MYLEIKFDNNINNYNNSVNDGFKVYLKKKTFDNDNGNDNSDEDN